MKLHRRALILGLVAGGLLGGTARADEAVGRFMLQDVNGAVVDDSNLQGRYSLVFFGYTSCPDVCPTTLLKIADIMKLLGADADKILPVFITLDPERDTPKHLSEYVSNFDDRILALRGTKPYTDAAVRAFGATYDVKVPDPAHPENYTIDHTASLFFVAPDGMIIKRFPYDVTGQTVADDVRRTLAVNNGSN